MIQISVSFPLTMVREKPPSNTGTRYFITQGSSKVSSALPDSTHLGSSQSSKVTCHYSIQSCFVILEQKKKSVLKFEGKILSSSNVSGS